MKAFLFIKDTILKNKSGASTLVLVFVVLLVLIFLGVMVIKTSTIESKIISNERIQEIEFYNAESAVNYAEKNIEILDPSITLKSHWGDPSDLSGLIATSTGISGVTVIVTPFDGNLNSDSSVVKTYSTDYEIEARTQSGRIIETRVKKTYVNPDE